MGSVEVVWIAGAIVLFALVSRLLDRLPLTMPMIFVGLGWIAHETAFVELDLEIEGIVLLGEVTLAVILFSDAVRIDVRALRLEAGLPARLLSVGLPMSIALGTVGIVLLLPDLSVWEAALVAAILAPTDAALGQAVVEDHAVPVRVRQGLNVESGLNDGLVLPAVLLFVALAAGEEADAGFWTTFALRQIGLGLLVGVAVGGIGGWALGVARERGAVDGIYAQLGTLALGITAFAMALAIDANGFLAAFVAGLTFGTVLSDEVADHVDEYTEDTGRLLAMIAFFVFGNVLVPASVSSPSVRVLLVAFLALTVGRMLPVALSIIDLRPAPQTILFIGWFGPRGLASILFGLILLEEELAAADELFAVIVWVVIGSIVLHGATATWGARVYGAWFRRHTEGMEAADMDSMPEAVEVASTRPRWGR